MYALVYTCKKKRKTEEKAKDSRVASVILSVYYAKRWAENNSFSRVLRSIRSDPIHRSSVTVLRAKGSRDRLFAYQSCALRNKRI